MAHNDRSMAAILPRPESCIRGPELTDTAQIAAEIRGAEAAALHAYAQGIELIISIQALQQDQERLEELKQTRAFLVEQLELMEREHPRIFDAARAAFDRQRGQPVASDGPRSPIPEEPCGDTPPPS